MKLKINKACDLNSISVLPPHSRRPNAAPTGADSSVFGKIQASQLRSQQSQQSFSQGVSSQLGMSSQLSQNSLDENVANEQKYGPQERENSVKRISSLVPATHTREDTPMPFSRSSNNLMRKWSYASAMDQRCQVSEELDNRIGLMETSVNRLGMILDSIQSDIMQVNKAIKEVSLEMQGIRQKLVAHDDSLQLMLKGEEDIKASLDVGLKSIHDQLKIDSKWYKLEDGISVLSALPDQIGTHFLKLQRELCGAFTKEIDAMVNFMKLPNHSHSVCTILPAKRGRHANQSRKEQPPSIKKRQCHADQSFKEKLPSMRKLVVPPKVDLKAELIPNIEIGRLKSLKPERATCTNRKCGTEHKQEEMPIAELEREQRVLIESDEDIDRGFSFLLKGKESGIGNYLTEEVKEDTERILRKARRRKRKHCDIIVLN
ncbi:PREDICTED: protein PAIR1 isoform X2 [Nelumbo nucifera]|uniref:Protein PAIR1 n=2 Tax=Nelumbo nucifera TaxID=4432 RepID=A0A822XN39_NELNU|nr:PREDICTED: protein PAIR1 isoform X2 [Nelumbo nucifera]DAD18938.1 TPA_asm: hypothetical protein HUJ06_020401 [Nelumbo nucifera]